MQAFLNFYQKLGKTSTLFYGQVRYVFLFLYPRIDDTLITCSSVTLADKAYIIRLACNISIIVPHN